MIIDVPSTDVVKIYRTLVEVVTPRPIAWVTTIDAEGRINLAPFSFFNAFGANPPVVVFSPGLRRDGTKKDTLRNLEIVHEFVLNAAVEDLAEPMNATSKDFLRARARPSTPGWPPALDQGPPAPRGRFSRPHGMPGPTDRAHRRRADQGQPGNW